MDANSINTSKKNRKSLVPIIECIFICGRQEFALRGHQGG